MFVCVDVHAVSLIWQRLSKSACAHVFLPVSFYYLRVCFCVCVCVGEVSCLAKHSFWEPLGDRGHVLYVDCQA